MKIMVGELAVGFLRYDELKLLMQGQTVTLLFDRLLLVTELSSWPCRRCIRHLRH